MGAVWEAAHVRPTWEMTGGSGLKHPRMTVGLTEEKHVRTGRTLHSAARRPGRVRRDRGCSD